MPGGAYLPAIPPSREAWQAGGNRGIVKGGLPRAQSRGALNEFLFCPLFFSTKEKWTCTKMPRVRGKADNYALPHEEKYPK